MKFYDQTKYFPPLFGLGDILTRCDTCACANVLEMAAPSQIELLQRTESGFVDVISQWTLWQRHDHLHLEGNPEEVLTDVAVQVLFRERLQELRKFQPSVVPAVTCLGSAFVLFLLVIAEAVFVPWFPAFLQPLLIVFVVLLSGIGIGWHLFIHRAYVRAMKGNVDAFNVRDAGKLAWKVMPDEGVLPAKRNILRIRATPVKFMNTAKSGGNNSTAAPLASAVPPDVTHLAAGASPGSSVPAAAANVVLLKDAVIQPSVTPPLSIPIAISQPVPTQQVLPSTKPVLPAPMTPQPPVLQAAPSPVIAPLQPAQKAPSMLTPALVAPTAVPANAPVQNAIPQTTASPANPAQSPAVIIAISPSAGPLTPEQQKQIIMAVSQSMQPAQLPQAVQVTTMPPAPSQVLPPPATVAQASPVSQLPTSTQTILLVSSPTVTAAVPATPAPTLTLPK